MFGGYLWCYIVYMVQLYMVEYGNGCNNIDSVLLYFISQQ